MADFPQETCPRGKRGECAYVNRGMGLKCQTCKRFLHPGDEGYVAVHQWHANNPEFADMGLRKAEPGSASR